MRILTCCVGALALAATLPALAAPGNGHGNGHKNDNRAERGHDGGNDRGPAHAGNGPADHNNPGRANVGANANAGPARANAHANVRNDNRGQGNVHNNNRGQGNDRARPGNADRGRNAAPGSHDNDRGRPVARRGEHRAGPGPAQRRDFAEARQRSNRIARERAENHSRFVALRDRDDRPARRVRYNDIDFYREHRWDNRDYRRRIERVRDRQRVSWQQQHCPPGLANKNRLCLPPGQYRKLYAYGARFDRTGYAAPNWYRAATADRPRYFLNAPGYDYRYADGYAYRIDPQTQRVSGLLPVLGGALGLGQQLPVGYNVYNVPTQYRPVYSDADYNYRYADNAIYRVDPQSSAILGVSELLTGNDIVVGQPLPTGYSAYNVPYGYRDRYYDSDQYNYRYANGSVYQVDPETSLVMAAINLFV